MLVAIDYAAEAGATFSEHEEGASVETFALVLLGYFEEFGYELSVECESGDVACCVDTETVDAHFDEFAVAVDEILSDGIVFGV